MDVDRVTLHQSRMSLHYFAYGSNMSTAQMKKRLNRVPQHKHARLDGYRLVFNKPMDSNPTLAYANVVPSPGDSVHGIVYDCTEDDLTLLDEYEGVPSGEYRRATLTIATKAGSISAVLYVAEVPSDAPRLPTSAEYMGRILTGAKEHRFGQNVIDAIRGATEVRNDRCS